MPDKPTPEQILRWRGTDGKSLEVVTIYKDASGPCVYSHYLYAGATPFSARYEWILDSDWQTRQLSVVVTRESSSRCETRWAANVDDSEHFTINRELSCSDEPLP